MDYAIKFSDEFKQQYVKLSKKDKQIVTRIDKKLDDILENPFIGKPLRYDLKGKLSVSVPPFRIIYEIEGDTIKIIKFGHRGEVYRKP